MVTLDHSLHHSAASASWWRRPRWLVLPVALPLFLAGGLAVGTLVNLGFTEGWGAEGAGLLSETDATAADGRGFSGSGFTQGQVCERMNHIVDTACGLKQRDRDASDIRACVAHELKYTMWSAYGCK